MTTVRQPLYEMGSAASRMLLKLVDGSVSVRRPP